MAALSDTEKLQCLAYSGLRVREDGHLTDWQDRPPRHGRPIGQDDDDPHVLRNRFTAQEDQALREWCVAADQEGVRGDRIFEQLEVVCPSHPWQAYRNRWRKTLRSSPWPTLTFEDPYPNLDAGDCGGAAPEHAPGQEIASLSPEEHQQELGSDSTAFYNRYLHGREVLDKLGVCDDAGLRRLLQETWVIKVYTDLRDATCKDTLSLTEVFAPSTSDVRGCPKFEEAIRVLDADGEASSVGEASLAGRAQSEPVSRLTEDPEVRFLVCAARLGSSAGCTWDKERQLRGWQGPCESAFWLMLWFRWINQDTYTHGQEVQMVQQRREIWRTFMDGLVDAHCARVSESASSEASGHPPGAREPVVSSGSTSETRVVAAIPTSSRWAAKQQVDRQLFLLSAQARNIYLSTRDGKLSAWGVDASHHGTCVLLPAMWEYTEPATLLEHPEAWPVDEPGTPRLRLSMGSFTFHWARVSAWFEGWPRSTSDLQHFLPPNDCRGEPSHMHGSHLCHHGLCINPTHLAYEDKVKNLDRVACLTAAAALRSYHATIPRDCSRHDPPCLLQSAALTTFEAFSMQFNILRVARGVDDGARFWRPASHPLRYQTFEQGPEPSQSFPDVGIPLTNIQTGQRETVETFHGLHWTCSLCVYPRMFKRITSFWNHLRTGHPEVDQSVILREVARSAASNKSWADRHSYNYRRDNPAMWEKIVQAQSSGFSWADLQAWRFSRGRERQEKAVTEA